MHAYAAEDGGGCLVGELLIDDRLGKGREHAAGRLELHGEGPGLVDDPRQRRVGLAQMSDGNCRREAEFGHRYFSRSNSGPAPTADAPSISRMRRLVAMPPLPEKPPTFPSAPSTRWQGTLLATGFRPRACPTPPPPLRTPRFL